MAKNVRKPLGFLLASGEFADQIIERLPLCDMRNSVSRFGAGLVGMSKLKHREIMYALFEVQIYVFFLLTKMAESSGQSDDITNILIEEILEKRVVKTSGHPDPDLAEIAWQRFDRYRETSKIPEPGNNPAYWLVNDINYVFLKKKLNRDETKVSSAWLGLGKQPEQAEDSEGFELLKACFREKSVPSVPRLFNRGSFHYH